MKYIKTFEQFINESDDNKKKRKVRKDKLSYDEKEMRKKGIHSWRGPNPSNK